jgi:hypothetical protein
MAILLQYVEVRAKVTPESSKRFREATSSDAHAGIVMNTRFDGATRKKELAKSIA